MGSGDIEVSHTSSIAVKLSGNVIQLRQDPFTGELLAVSSIRSTEVKEPFVFKAFEDNSMTILVQPKDPAQPLSGCLSFGRRLDNISATQQLPLCELRFDVSGGDTSFVIKEDMIFSTLEVDADINGHSPNTVDVPPPKFRTIEEEDPYEKIEIKKSKDGTADIKTKSQEKICQQYFDKWYKLEAEMFFLQREVILRDLQINELTISVSDMKGKFIKPTLKKVSKYENKFAKLQEKAAKFAFANQLKAK